MFYLCNIEYFMKSAITIIPCLLTFVIKCWRGTYIKLDLNDKQVLAADPSTPEGANNSLGAIFRCREMCKYKHIHQHSPLGPVDHEMCPRQAWPPLSSHRWNVYTMTILGWAVLNAFKVKRIAWNSLRDKFFFSKLFHVCITINIPALIWSARTKWHHQNRLTPVVVAR